VANRKLAPALCALVLTAPLLGALLAGPGSALPPPTVGSSLTLSNRFNETSDLQVAYGPTGDGLAAWVESNGSTRTVWSARDNTTSGWAAPAFHYATSASAGRLMIGMDAAGTASVAWISFTSPNQLWYARSFANGSASASALLRTANTGIIGISPYTVMEVGPTGSMFVFWSETGGVSASWAVVVDAAGAVDGPTRIDGGSTAVFEKVMAPDPLSGAATALACDRRGTVANLTESRYAPGTGWTTPVVVAPNLSNGCSTMDGGIDSAGNINIVFYASLNDSLVLIRRPAGGPWAAPQPFYTTTGSDNLETLKVDVQAGGTALVSWRTRDMMWDLYSAFVSSFEPGSGWSAPTRLASNVIQSVNLALASTPGGSGLALFTPPVNDTFTLSVAQFTRMTGCGGWSAPVDTGLASNYNYLAAGLAPSGDGHLLFQAYNGAHWEARAAPVSLGGPARLKVTVPSPGSHTSSSLMVFEGTVEPGATVSAAGATTVALSDGSFSMLIPLRVGVNSVDVLASFADPWLGCRDEVTVPVIYDDPLPQLLLDVEQARADLNATTAALAVAQAQLAAAQVRADSLEAAGNATAAELDAAKGDLAAAQASLDATAADLLDVQAQLNTTSEEMARVKVQFPWLESNLTAAQADLAGAQAEVDALQASKAETQIDLFDAQARIMVLETQQNASAALIRESADNSAALAGQVATLSLVSFIALLAAIAGLIVAFVIARGGRGGSGGAGRVQEPTPSKGGAAGESTEPGEEREPERLSDSDR